MGRNVERKWRGRKERRQRFMRMEYQSIVWLHDHNKGKRKFDINTLEEIKEIESGQLNSYGGI
jgi:hypothetical protein